MMSEKFKILKDCEFEMVDWDMYAYNRLDYIKGKWYNKWFVVAGTNGNQEISGEMQAFSDFMADVILPGGYQDIPKFAQKFDLENADEDGGYHYIAYCEGENVNIKILITDMEKNYHLRIFFYPKK